MTTILTYGPNPQAPAAMRWAAAMVPTGPGTHWVATGATESEARGKLEAMLPGAKKVKREAVEDLV